MSHVEDSSLEKADDQCRVPFLNGWFMEGGVSTEFARNAKFPQSGRSQDTNRVKIDLLIGLAMR